MRIMIFLFISLLTFVEVYAADDTAAPIYLHDHKEDGGVEQEPTWPEPPEGSTARGEKPIYVHDYETETSKSPGESSTSVRITYGSFRPASDSGDLQGGSRGSAGGGEFGINWKGAISCRIELLSLSSEYDTPSSLSSLGWSSINDKVTLTTTGLLFGVKVSYPKDRSYRFHATGGLGFFRSELTASGQSGGWISWPINESDTDSGLGAYAGVGVEIGSEKYVVGLEYRRFSLKGNFRDFGVSADIGGDIMGLSFGWLY